MSNRPSALPRLWSWLLAAGLLAGTTSVAGAGTPAATGAVPGSAPTRPQVQLVLPLKVDEAGLRRLALAVSTPGSPEYRHYASVARVASRFGASPATRLRVLSWLRAHGATGAHVDATGSLAEASMSSATADQAFAAPAAVMAAGGHKAFVDPPQPQVPRALAGAITAVLGLDSKPLPISRNVETAPDRPAPRTQSSSERTRTGTSGGCDAGRSAGEVAGDPATAAFTPNQYLTAYGFNPLHKAGVLGQGQRVALIEFDAIKMPDLRRFARCFNLPLAPVRQFKVGRKRLPAPGGETTLDTEVLDAAAPDLAEIDLYETRPNIADLLKAIAAPLQRKRAQPQVISVSLGTCERDMYAALGKAGVASWEFELEAAAVSGSTVVAASGDTGSAGCQRADGQPVHRLAVNYPASSSFVTAVGGTNLVLRADNHISQEIVWNDAQDPVGGAGAGGGGFSAKLMRPAYQDGVVTKSTRALPDVSLLADIRPGYAIYCTTRDCQGAGWMNVGGASAAAPLFGGGLALIDQRLHADGRQYLGFVNPLLYRIGSSSGRAQIFHDVTQGGNDVGSFIPGGRGRPLGCCEARPGYDEASGWGSVNFASLLLRVEHQEPPELATVTARVPPHQHPLRDRGLVMRVGCSGPCHAEAEARIAIGRSRSFRSVSRVRLTQAGSRRVELRFTRAELRELRSARAHRVPVVVVAFGALTDSKHRLLKSSRPIRLRLSG